VPATPVDKPEPTATAGVPIIIQPTRVGPLQSDLQIQISDNSGTYTPGTSITYTILVTNLGPDDAPRFNVTANIPAVISGLTVNCTPANLCGTNASSGNSISFTGATLPSSGVITISVSGIVASGATGDLVNTVSIVIPSGVRVRDPDLANNTVTDRDTQLSVYDLAITKTDGVDTYTTTAPINYIIVVTNSGPSDAIGINISDNFLSQIASWTWTCTNVLNASGCNGVTNSTSNFTDTVTIRSGGRIEYSARANPAGIPQNIANTVNVSFPSGPGFIDPNLANNSATDIDIPAIDLQITKNDGVTAYNPGGTLTYTVTVTNNSTFNLTGITVSDPKPLQIADWIWCISPPCPAPIITDFTSTINLAAGTSMSYTVTANISGVGAGDLTNTATVSAPAGLVDVLLANNTATDIDIPAINVDLQIIKDDGILTYIPGGIVNYTVIVTNNSAIALNGVTVTDNIPPLIDPLTWTWTCTPNPGPLGAACTPGPSNTSINDTAVNLPAGGSVTYSITATVVGAATGELRNTATVSPPAGFADTVPGNNTAVDIDNRLLEYIPTLGLPDNNILFVQPPGVPFDFALTTPITIDGNTADYEIVFYEWENPVNFIDLDQVIISIGDGTNWYVVYYWGDNLVDPNSSPLGSTSEPDNFRISTSLLYGAPYQTGILIDADGGIGVPPNGTYQYIRVTSPPGDADGACDIDAIGVWP
jgi:uncharacterized repeat protein (TIGR01451 family)